MENPYQHGLLGDMLGIRPILEDHGFHYRLAYLSQAAYNAAGGYDHNGHVAYIDQFSLTFNWDLEGLTGIPDAAIDGNIVNRNHNDNLVSKRLADPRVSYNDLSQESYGGQSITKLGWLSFSRSFMDRRLHWRIGMMNKNEDFDQIIPCDFQLMSLCGGKSAYSLTWNNWNVHTWGTAFQYALTPGVKLKIGIMEQNPTASYRSHAWSWSTKGSKGFLLPAEIEWKTFINNQPGIYNLGILFTNSHRQDLSNGKSQSDGLTDPDGYRYYNRTWYMWAGFNQQLTQVAGDPHRGLSLAFSMGQADQRTTYLQHTSSISLRYRGLFDIRPEDWLGFGVAYLKYSNHYTAAQEARNAYYQVDDYGNALYSPVPGHSVNMELYYRFKVTPWLEIQPDLQYWYRPSGIKETQDAWVTGLKTVVTF
nr:carbohydrate porin [uncultured Klebsiella sp.]